MKKNGFTLVELLVTVAMIAIVLTLGVPAFQSTIHKNKLIAQTNEFVALMNFSRSESIKRGTRITICASDPAANGNSSMTKCTGTWDKGWLVFADRNGDCTLTTDGDQTIRVHEGVRSSTTFTAILTTSSAEVTCVGFNPGGTSAITTDSVTFTLCDTAIKKGYDITMTLIGHLSSVAREC